MIYYYLHYLVYEEKSTQFHLILQMLKFDDLSKTELQNFKAKLFGNKLQMIEIEEAKLNQKYDESIKQYHPHLWPFLPIST